jgi:hypothetical protein
MPKLNSPSLDILLHTYVDYTDTDFKSIFQGTFKFYIDDASAIQIAIESFEDEIVLLSKAIEILKSKL